MNFLIKNIPIYSKFCGGFNIKHAKNLDIKYNKIFDYIREGDSKYHNLIHQNNLIALKNTTNSYHAIKLSGLKCNNIEDYLKEYYEICNKNNNKILIDAENYLIQDFINDFTNKIILKYNKNQTIFFKTYQMYRIDSFNILTHDIEKINNLGIKLVRGAYYNQDFKYNILHSCKNNTDNDYNNAIKILSETNIKTIIATHNNYSCDLALKYQKNNNFLFAQLLGMNDKLSDYLINENQKVFKYIPYGNPIISIPYLTRRLYENYDILKYIV